MSHCVALQVDMPSPLSRPQWLWYAYS